MKKNKHKSSSVKTVIQNKIYDREIEVDKDNFEKALRNQNIKDIEDFSKDLSFGMICAICNEIESIKTIHKGGTEFFNDIVNFLENKSEEYLNKNAHFSEFLISQNTRKIKTNEQRKEKNIIKFRAQYTETNNSQYVKSRNETLIHDFKNKYYDLYFDNITINNKTVNSIMSFDMNFKLQNKFARLCGSNKNSIKLLTTVFEHPNYHKMSKHHFIRHAANAASNVETLQFLMDSDSKSFKKGFDTMIERDEFWNSLKPGNNQNQKEHLEKVIWLEKNNMGYTSNKMKYLIHFICKLSNELIMEYLQQSNNDKINPYIQKSMNRYVKYEDGNLETKSDKIIQRLKAKNKEDENTYAVYSHKDIPADIAQRMNKRDNIIDYLQEIEQYGNIFYYKSADNKINNIDNFTRIKSILNYHNINTTLDSKNSPIKPRKI